MEEITTFNPQTLKKIFSQYKLEGGFSSIILTDDSGLPIISSGDDSEDADNTAATVSRIQQTILQTKDHLNMTQLEEVALNDSNGKQLVIRPFNTKSGLMFLAVILPGKMISYKRIMKKVISKISREWII